MRTRTKVVAVDTKERLVPAFPSNLNFFFVFC
jgi:hypothetical protein